MREQLDMNELFPLDEDLHEQTFEKVNVKEEDERMNYFTWRARNNLQKWKCFRLQNISPLCFIVDEIYVCCVDKCTDVSASLLVII